MSELTCAERAELVKTSLAAACPSCTVTRSLENYDTYTTEQLTAGVFQLVSLGESGYRNYNGREAMDGSHKFLLVVLTRVAETAGGKALEDAEFALVEKVKAWLRALPPQLCCLVATGFRQSAQLDYPYGAVAFDLECRDNG